MMEKRAVIDENTPHSGDRPQDMRDGEPTTKQAADQLQSNPVSDMIDAVAAQSAKNRK